MRLTRVVLTALAVAACAPSVRSSGYAPKWRVGDWWIVKTWEIWPNRGVWEWNYRRYDVAGIEKVGQNDCYVLEIRGSRRPSIGSSGIVDIVLHVRTDNLLAVRRTVMMHRADGEPLPPMVRYHPLGLFGPFVAEPRLPRFPLQLMNQDTVFKKERRDDCYAYLREISRPADPALVERLLAEGDTADIRVVRPSGAVYQVRNELGGNVIPGPQPGEREITQSLQLWSDDLPWRPFEELVGYSGPNSTRSVTERSWLIAVGHKGK